MLKMDEREVSIKLDDLDSKAQTRIKEALEKAGIKLKESSAGSSVPGKTGTIETSIELNTTGLDDEGVANLRATGFSREKHAEVLKTVIQGALGDARLPIFQEPFLEWIWCEWLKFAAFRETFKKQYNIRLADGPSDSSGAASSQNAGW